MFQFHYGSIKIVAHLSLDGFALLFQFHYGSIKMRLACQVYSHYASFNSTMVRLKFRHVTGRHYSERVSIPLWFD